MIKYYLDEILIKIDKDEIISNLEGVAKYNNRSVYIDGGEYQEHSVDLVFLVDTGYWFKKTVAFTLVINSFNYEINVIKHFSLCTKTFNRKNYKSVSTYIIDEIINFQNSNKTNNKIINI